MMRFAQVVRVNQARRTVDLVYLDTREPAREALVVGKASNVGGAWDVPSVPLPVNAQATGTVPPATPSMMAVVDDIDGRAVVMGFVPALGNQVAVTPENLEIDRHPSGVVQTIEADGSIQTIHPGGVTLRIGTPALLNPATIAADQNWHVAAGAPPTVTLITPKATMVIDPATGNVTVVSQGDVSVTAKDATVNASSNVTVTAGAVAQITAPEVLLGSAAAGMKRVVVDGDPTAKGDTVIASQNTHVFAL